MVSTYYILLKSGLFEVTDSRLGQGNYQTSKSMSKGLIMGDKNFLSSKQIKIDKLKYKKIGLPKEQY